MAGSSQIGKKLLWEKESNFSFYHSLFMAVGDAYVLPSFLTPILTQLFFPKPPTTLLTCFCRDERRKYTRKKCRLNWGSNSQPPGHESDTLTTEGFKTCAADT